MRCEKFDTLVVSRRRFEPKLTKYLDDSIHISKKARERRLIEQKRYHMNMDMVAVVRQKEPILILTGGCDYTFEANKRILDQAHVNKWFDVFCLIALAREHTCNTCM